MTCFCTCFYKHNVVISCLFFTLFKTHLSIYKKQSVQSSLTFLINTYLLSFKSVLLPTNTIITSVPRSALTSSIHLDVFTNEFRSNNNIRFFSRFNYNCCYCYLRVISYTTTQTEESLI